MNKGGAFEKVDARPDYPGMEQEVIRFWKANSIFHAIRSSSEGKKPFVFLEGPPTANGMPHMGHALTRSVKDVFLRYKLMTGHHVTPYIAGWDCHGLPVELEVEKELGLESKEQILKYGLARFNHECKKSVFKYKEEWAKMDERIGLWMDFENAYVTMTDPYIESVWWSLKTLWEKKLLEKGHYVVPYCPRCGTPLSSHEVAQGYKTVKDLSVTLKFKVKNPPPHLGPDLFILAWTTTPWTLPGNVALAVGKDITYAVVSQFEERYILALDLLEKVMEGDYDLMGTMKGSEMGGWEYEPLFDFMDLSQPEKVAYSVVEADFVTTSEGTGVVHTAVMYGEDDYKLGMARGFPAVHTVDLSGRFNELVIPWNGRFVKEDGFDLEIAIYLHEHKRLYSKGSYEHTYPFCWRCESPLLYYALDSWFVKMSKLRSEMMANNETVNWKPGHLKDGRFGNFLKELKDWALSRNRFWGTPLPIWKCKDGHMLCIGSKAELAKHSLSPLPDDFELHRPWVDEVKLKCPTCSKEMVREEYVVDTWFDSGSATFAQYHFPFENEEEFQSHFPVDFITEAVDQTRGWFYTLLALSTSVFGKPAYKNCLTLGLILDEDGQKMSKSKGNAIAPVEAFDTVGADTVRLHLYSIPVWSSTRFSNELALETRKKTLDTLWNVYFFFISNAHLDNFTPEGDLSSDNTLDRWLLSRLQGTISAFSDGFDIYELHHNYRELVAFIDDLSNWYLRRSRKRFWTGTMTKEKSQAYETLYHTLVTLIKAMAPMTPFFSESLYKNMVISVDGEAPKSVHMHEYPGAVKSLRNIELERAMAKVIKVAEAGRHSRQKVNIKLRQPLESLVIAGDIAETSLLEGFTDILKDELNVKEVIITQETAVLKTPTVKMNFKIAGKKLMADGPKVKAALEQIPGHRAHELLLSGDLEVEGYQLQKEDVLVDWEVKDGFSLAEADGLTVAVKTTITEELRLEGLMREIVRRIQSMRKEMDLGYDQRIVTHLQGGPDVEAVMRLHGDFMKQETLSDTIIIGKIEGGLFMEWDIDGFQLEITIVPV
ncbi:MAG TPA: isoleucine--tRNA ligase [Euryarchaeota archaeon]|nr:isoleucine--tRNA ligase [Euryarchaeota archaeon]